MVGGPALQSSLSGLQDLAIERGMFYLTKLSTANLFAKIAMVLAAGVSETNGTLPVQVLSGSTGQNGILYS